MEFYTFSRLREIESSIAQIIPMSFAGGDFNKQDMGID